MAPPVQAIQVYGYGNQVKFSRYKLKLSNIVVGRRNKFVDGGIWRCADRINEIYYKPSKSRILHIVQLTVYG